MFNALQFYKDYHIKYWTEGKNVSPDWINVQCIHCQDTSNHLGWNYVDGYYNCWKCGRHDTAYTVSKLLRTPMNQAKDIVFDYSQYNAHLNFINKKKSTVSTITPPGSTLSKFHKKYLKKRGFDPNHIIKKYGITGTGPKETWQDHDFQLRIIIPIYFQRKLISFQGRDITDKQEFRYKGCPQEKAVQNYKEMLYNIDRVKGTRIVVLEGIMDVWRLGDGFVSSFGTSLTNSQLNLLSYFEEIFIMFDPEPEAQQKAKKYAQQLSSMGRIVEVLEPTGDMDPADMSEDMARLIRKELFGEVYYEDDEN